MPVDTVEASRTFLDLGIAGAVIVFLIAALCVSGGVIAFMYKGTRALEAEFRAFIAGNAGLAEDFKEVVLANVQATKDSVSQLQRLEAQHQRTEQEIRQLGDVIKRVEARGA